ncbi:hypothetical protein N656DRAFT_768007 [Canariomyces notabilis]|uniref:DUF7735 domain-containing protein n=1 Tax=Canariomyces notabilis TaxID=2074819 RepID=A0AAN6TEM5_9PEZI|nr:hypothetical protein N656DRAFT_768007 [Canariomyces arenarius]
MRLAVPFLGLLATAQVQAYLDVGHLIARQTSVPEVEDMGDCISAIMEVAGSAPFPPPEIIDVMTSFYMTATGVTDYQCGWQTALPGDLVDDWYSYQSRVLDWYSASSAELNSALQHCPAGYESSAGPCSKSISGLAAPVPATGTAGGNGGSGGGATSKNAAPKETGYVVFTGAAVAGLLGVVAAL